LDFESSVLPEHREELRYRNEQGRLRNVLTKRVPILGARAIGQVARRLLKRHGLSTEQIDWWAVHPGGTAVLERVGKELDLPEESLQFSHEILHEYGNMSSPSVLFVLQRLLERGRPSRGQKGLLLSFGAGFSAFAALVEF
jgi:predicted naringenin-chalcone synthase